MRDWEPWQSREYAESRLEMWGNPTDPPEKWNKHKYNRLRKLPKLIRGSTVLDVGCGLGHSYAVLRSHVTEYLGVDSAKAMIDICHRFFDESLFTVGDAYDLSSFGVYDTVLAIQLLIHLPNLVPLKQLWRHARRCVVFTVWPPQEQKIRQRTDGLIGHVYSKNDIINAIRALDGVGGVEVYRDEDVKKDRMFWIMINKNGSMKINRSVFNKIGRITC